MSAEQCHCGCTDIDYDPARGDAVCTRCGSVLEEGIVVSEVQFVQDSGGASRAIGQLVTSDRDIASGLNLGYGYGLRKESREITLRNARKRIQELAAQLKLQDHCVDIAHNFYKMALIKKLTKGRKNSLVIAACVYMVCRKHETPHMLLDLSDILQVSVYSLGKTYLKLSAELCINTPAIDPSLYILRFAHQLQFGEKTHDVSVTASRLVHRMKKDWIHTGRRPSGLCGAALLVAARLHNFNRTVDDVIKVVKVCQATVRKRLTEFSDTPSGRLTLDEFMSIDLEEEQDPPSFKAARKKKVHELENEEEVTNQVVEVRKLIEEALEKTKEKSERKGGFWQFTPIEDSGGCTESVEEIASQIIAGNAMHSIGEVIQGSEDTTNSLPTESDLNRLLLPHLDPNNRNESVNNSFNDCVTDGVAKNGVDESSIANTDTNCELDFTDLNDEELDMYILKTDESKLKTKLWVEINADYLKEQKEREERLKKEEEENAKKPEKKKRKRQKRVPIQANTAGEAIEKMLQQKKISLKINYDVLGMLSKGNKNQAEQLGENNVPTQSDSSPSKPLKRIYSRTKNKPAPPPIPLSIKQGITALVENHRQQTALTVTVDDDDSDGKEICPPKKLQKLSEDEVKPIFDEVKPIFDEVNDVPSVSHPEEITLNNDNDDNEEVVEEEEEEDEEADIASQNPALASFFKDYGADEAEYSDYYDDD